MNKSFFIYIKLFNTLSWACDHSLELAIKTKTPKWERIMKVYQYSNTLLKCKETNPKHSWVRNTLGIMICASLNNIRNKNSYIKLNPNWVFNVPSERFWNINIESGLAFSIWNCVQKFIAKRMTDNQNCNLIPNH